MDRNNWKTRMLLPLGLLAAAYAAAGVEEDGRAPFTLEASQIRCWQYGELIFAEDGWNSVESSQAKKVFRLKPRKPSGQALYLLDLEHSTCLLKVEGP